jgi:hypothetical protein
VARLGSAEELDGAIRVVPPLGRERLILVDPLVDGLEQPDRLVHRELLGSLQLVGQRLSDLVPPGRG